MHRLLPRFLSRQELRRQITSSINKTRSYNNFSRRLLFSGEGGIPDNDPEEQTIWHQIPPNSPPCLTGHLKRFGCYLVDAEDTLNPLNGEMPQPAD